MSSFSLTVAGLWKRIEEMKDLKEKLLSFALELSAPMDTDCSLPLAAVSSTACREWSYDADSNWPWPAFGGAFAVLPSSFLPAESFFESPSRKSLYSLLISLKFWLLKC